MHWKQSIVFCSFIEYKKYFDWKEIQIKNKHPITDYYEKKKPKQKNQTKQ